MQIVNTPQVQRLRDLMQLGLGSYVYPGATHTRFAHSIGLVFVTAWLTKKVSVHDTIKCETHLGPEFSHLTKSQMDVI